MKKVVFCLILLFASANVFAGTIYVPADQLTIQDGINAAVTGDTVLVAPGTYYEYINFNGKAIMVKSESGPEVTIIDGQNFPSSVSLVTFATNETVSSVLDGFTVQNGYKFDGNGGGIYCYKSSPTISNNVISKNYRYGIYCYSHSSPTISSSKISENKEKGIFLDLYSSPTISRSEISRNSGTGIFCSNYSSTTIANNTISDNIGNGIYAYNSSVLTVSYNVIAGNGGYGVFFVPDATISNNIISGNDGGGISFYYYSTANQIKNNIISGNGGYGIDFYYYSSPTIANNIISGNAGGIRCFDYSYPTITNNTISGNSNEALYIGSSSWPIATNNVFWNNSGQNEIYATSSSYLTINHSLFDPSKVSGNYTGQNNLNTDPLFSDPDNGDYHLLSTSPCIDAGDSSVVETGDVDIDGDPRILDGNGDTVETVDIGADEFNLTACDSDGDGHLHPYCGGDDCDDTNPGVYPSAVEVCDGVDNDCDGAVLENEVDNDGDGELVCEGDCDDSNPAVYTGAEELCDGLDNDCDNVVGDEEVDNDGDGYSACAGDCDDTDVTVYTDAEEICDGVDNDCDGEVDEDFDWDGDGYSSCAGDCDDSDPEINPEAAEIKGDGIDSNCNGQDNCGTMPIRSQWSVLASFFLLLLPFVFIRGLGRKICSAK